MTASRGWRLTLVGVLGLVLGWIVLSTLFTSRKQADAIRLAAAINVLAWHQGVYPLAAHIPEKYQYVCLLPPYMASLPSEWNLPEVAAISQKLQRLKLDNSDDGVIGVVLISHNPQSGDVRISHEDINRPDRDFDLNAQSNLKVADFRPSLCAPRERSAIVAQGPNGNPGQQRLGVLAGALPPTVANQ